MRVATWNVNSIRARIESITQWITATRPDVVLLQEIKCTNDNFPSMCFEDLGYNIALNGQKSYNGVAILSKIPFDEVNTAFQCTINVDQCRFIEAVILGWRFISVYIPNGMEPDSDKYSYKLQFYTEFYDYLKSLRLDHEPVVIGGDFNVAADLGDAYNPQAFVKPAILTTLPERQAFFKLLSLGLYDGLKLHYKSQSPSVAVPFTWWDYRQDAFNANRGFRIDHLLVSPRAADLIQSGDVDLTPRGDQKPSDHAPVWLQFNLKTS